MRRYYRLPIAVVVLALALGIDACCQTASTGAVIGVTFDITGAVVPGVTIHCAQVDGVEVRSTTSDTEGRFGMLLLPPGNYRLQAEKADYQPESFPEIHVTVTETRRLELHLNVARHFEQLQVSANTNMVQAQSSSLGQVVDAGSIRRLPLVTRNFTQITGLFPGVTVGVYNAGELGTGAIAQSQIGRSNDGMYVHGARSYDNNWQLDGISVSDVQGSGSISGGIPIPNPDALEEFKVQTGLYDAGFGRGAGANISVITRSGGDSYHGSVFEFLRNDVLNANDYFRNSAGQPRPPLKQNQFGGTLSGPIRKNKLFVFNSYQGTRQTNGVAAGQPRIACSATLNEPPLTNDRSPQAVGALFGGLKGASGGVAVNPDGSNINPVALALLNYKLPDGSYLIPTPQSTDSSQPFARRGFSAFSSPCEFDEDQGLANIDYVHSQKSQIAGRLFLAKNHESVTFPGGAFNPTGNIQGFASDGSSDFAVVSLAHTYVLSSSFLNQARIGFVRMSTGSSAKAPFKWSDVGVSEGEMNSNNDLPSLSILGSISMASVLPRTYTQDSFVFNDVFTAIHGVHTLKFGGSVTRLQDNLDFAGAASYLQFLSWPDFLLGLNSSANGTGSFSNVFASSDIFGLLNREFRVWEGWAFAQDDFSPARFLTVNLGLRYERIGQFGDELGRNSSFDINKANPSPPATGSLNGYIVPSNFPGTAPPGVIRADNTFGNYGEGQNAVAPRIGFAWQVLPKTSGFVLRGGYGIYYSRPTGHSAAESVLSAPFSLTRISTGAANNAATFQMPFAQPFPTPSSFPLFLAYSPTTAIGISALAPNFRPAVVQQYSLGIQVEPRKGWLIETAYVGTRGTHLQRFRSLNQALDATASNPINGVTSNTLANVSLRVPLPGVRPDALRELESEGSSWYNGLEASLTKRLSYGLQFLASYTFSKVLDTDGADINSTSSGNALTLGDQNSPAQRWGRASFDRTHRFIVSSTWNLPGPPNGVMRAAFGNWWLAAIATIQSGTALTIADTNSTNVFGINEDRAQLSGACSTSQLVRGGSIGSKLNSYLNTACFTTPPIIGADAIGTAFGNSATGIVSGPRQANLDLSLAKTAALRWLTEKSTLEFRAEFFNALNHPQFSNPDTNFSSPTFGVISSTAVSPRVGQLALTYEF